MKMIRGMADMCEEYMQFSTWEEEGVYGGIEYLRACEHLGAWIIDSHSIYSHNYYELYI